MKILKSYWGLKMNRKNWKVIKNMMKIGMFFCVVFAMLKGWDYYLYQKENPETEYVMQELGIDNNGQFTQGKDFPEEYYIKVNMLNTIRSIVYLGLFFFVLFEICSFLEKPEEHWITQLKPIAKKVEKWSKKIEED